MFESTVARLLLLAHLVAAFASMGLTLHLVLWLRRYCAGRYGLRRAVQRFAAWSALAYGTSFLLGNIVYPTYKVRVRLAYLDDPEHLEAAAKLAREREAAVAALHMPKDAQQSVGGAPEAGTPNVTAAGQEPAHGSATSEDLPKRAGAIARLFDSKEHIVAFGLFASVGLWWLLRHWRLDHADDPHGAVLAPYVRGFAYVACAACWYGGVVGAWVAMWRTV